MSEGAPDAAPVQGTQGTQGPAAPEVKPVAPELKPTGPVAEEVPQFVSSLGELKRMDPKTYNAMMKSIAQHIVREMRRSQARFKKMMREGRQS